MMCECTKCKGEFLSEADPYMVLPKPSGTELICHRCFDGENQALRELIKEARPSVEYMLELLVFEHNQKPYLEWLAKAKEVIG